MTHAMEIIYIDYNFGQKEILAIFQLTSGDNNIFFKLEDPLQDLRGPPAGHGPPVEDHCFKMSPLRSVG